MRNITVVVKPTHECNMRCKHCYHEEKGYEVHNIEFDAILKMDKMLLTSYDRVDFIWHGGEPLLMGLDFYKAVLCDQKNIIVLCLIAYKLMVFY
ncbi:MAG: hypothetical protein R3Y32_03145 [Bacillota bacterium]